MTGLLIGLVAGVGLFLVWSSFWKPLPAVERRPGRHGLLTRLGDDLVQGGFPQTGPATLLAGCAVTGLLVAAVGYAVSGVVPIGIAFGLLAAYGPFALVRARARRRRALLRDLWPDAVDNITSGVRAGLGPAGGARPAVGAGAGRAASGVRGLRRGLPDDGQIPGVPRRAQGAAQ